MIIQVHDRLTGGSEASVDSEESESCRRERSRWSAVVADAALCEGALEECPQPLADRADVSPLRQDAFAFQFAKNRFEISILAAQELFRRRRDRRIRRDLA